MTWRKLLNLSARAEEKYWNTGDQKFYDLAQDYLDRARAA